jgi:type IV pilus assembly protein PilA
MSIAMQNLRAKNKKLDQGFTLVELMVVIVIVGLLSSVALPQYMGIKDKAKLNSQISELAGLARECSSAIIAEGPYPKAVQSTTNTGLSVNGNCNGGDTATAPSSDISYTTSSANISGAKCGPLSITTGKKCKATVGFSNGEISYSEI